MNRNERNLHGFFKRCNFQVTVPYPHGEGWLMAGVLVWIFSFLLFLFGAQAVAAAGDPVSIKLNWKPGETYRYKMDLESSTTSPGQTLHMRVSTNLSLKVVGIGGTASPPPLPAATQQMASPTPSFALGGRTTDIELRYGDMNTSIGVSGRTLAVHVDPNAVKATLNGSPLPASQMEAFRKEIQPLQELLRTVVRIQMSDSGRIVSVAGLEKLDAATQKDLAMEILESMLLPDKPLKVGEHYVENRTIRPFASANPGTGAGGGDGATVELQRTLKSVRKVKGGINVAEFSAPLQRKFDDFPLDEKGTRGTAETNLIFKSHIDVDKGTILKEAGEGTILVTPRGAGKLTLKIRLTMSLVEPKKYQSLAASF